MPYKPRPVTAKSPVKQVRVDLSHELEPRLPSPDPTDSLLIKPLRFRMFRYSSPYEDEPTPAQFPREIVKKPSPVLHIETHNLTITSKQSATAPGSATHTLLPDIESTLLFGTAALYRPHALAIDSFPLFTQIEMTPEKSIRKRSEALPLEAISFDDFMNKVALTPKNGPQEKLGENVNETGSLPRSQVSTPYKSNLLQFKEAAEMKEKKRIRRLNAAIKIQSIVRKFLAKCRLNRLKKEITEKTEISHLHEIAQKVKFNWSIRRISASILTWIHFRRQEKARLFALFQSHCAVLIQKNWRGYQTRRVYREVITTARRQQAVFEALVVAWRLRKVLKLKPVQEICKQIRDMEMVANGKNGGELAEIARKSLPSLKRNLGVLIEKMQKNGTWLRYLGKFSVPQTPKSSELNEEQPSVSMYRPVNFTPFSPSKSFEDRPIRPMRDEYASVAEQSEEIRSETPKPKKKFSNFLRKSSRISTAKTQNMESDPEEDKPIESIPVPASLEIDESQQIESSMKSIKPYLKRKSQSIKPKKVKWNVTKRIDCWVERAQKTVEEQKRKQEVMQDLPETPKREQAVQRPLDVDALEAVFADLLRSHTDSHAYFKRPGRRDKSTFLPQFQQFSYFITHFTEDIFRDTFVALERHYKLLCREDWLDS